ncbi:MAG: phosphatase PAP2 family protein [Trueperaceae bacterium]|nr:phosphatase PAP2 family protein [Trueperaceae bacterium]
METVHLIQSVAAPWLDVLMTLITDLGSGEAYVALVVVTYLAIDARAGRALGITLMVSFLINQYAKGWFDTPRPFELDPSVVRTERALESAAGPGFPSGHAQGATTFWGLAAVLAGRAWFTVAAVVLIAAVAFSRLYLGVHVPLDVVGGLLIGTAVVMLAALWWRSGFEPPTWFVAVLAVALPFAVHLAFPTPESDLLTGAIAALAVGPLLVRHRTDGPWSGRVAVAVVGLVLAFTVLVASSELLPEAVKRHPVGGYLRYVVLGASATVVAPWIGQAFGWAPPARRR